MHVPQVLEAQAEAGVLVRAGDGADGREADDDGRARPFGQPDRRQHVVGGLFGGEAAAQPRRDADQLGRRRVLALGVEGAVELRQQAWRGGRFPLLLRPDVLDLGEQERGEGLGGAVVEGDRGGQPEPGEGVQAVAQFDGGQGVEAEVVERPVEGDRGRTGAEHGGDLGGDRLQRGLLRLPSGSRARRWASSGPVAARSPAVRQAGADRASEQGDRLVVRGGAGRSGPGSSGGVRPGAGPRRAGAAPRWSARRARRAGGPGPVGVGEGWAVAFGRALPQAPRPGTSPGSRERGGRRPARRGRRWRGGVGRLPRPAEQLAAEE